MHRNQNGCKFLVNRRNIKEASSEEEIGRVFPSAILRGVRKDQKSHRWQMGTAVLRMRRAGGEWGRECVGAGVCGGGSVWGGSVWGGSVNLPPIR